MSRSAMHRSDERSERDHRALVWTVKSLANDVELEIFVDAIPDLYGDCVPGAIHMKTTSDASFKIMKSSSPPALPLSSTAATQAFCLPMLGNVGVTVATRPFGLLEVSPGPFGHPDS